jgi:hypothetical protein
MEIAKVAKKSAFLYFCKNCDYKTLRKFNYDKHKLTSKHLESQNGNIFSSKSSKSSSESFICINCDKQYSTNAGLWKHKQKCNCNDEEQIKISDEPTDKELIVMLMKKNDELQTMMMEVIKNGTHNITNTNSHNKTFNLQFFLNETCKDAMNIMDFIESIKLQLTDLERVGELGYVDGISNIIIKNLKAMDITQRPIHCTDKKREVLYVKDENLWQKEDHQNKKVRTAIKKIADKNMRLIPYYKEKYPDCNKSVSNVSDKYNTIIIESMGGKGENDLEKENKIISNISKEVFVVKE